MPRSRFHILGQVGQGQFGRVFCAIDRSTGNLVALKDLDLLRYPTKKFLKEISHLVHLQHPKIVAFQGLEHHRTGRYLVTDYCHGGTLREWMESGEKVGIRQSLALILDILDGLSHAHERGIVHCDIKPENILLNVAPDGWTAKITDFGISRLIAEADIPRSDGGYTGSPAYMAPERFYGKYSPASDLYAVGILLYELLVGDRPFSGLPGELAKAHLTQSVKIPASIPHSPRSIIATALRKLPRRRFQSAAEMRREIEKVLSEFPRLTPDVEVTTPSRPAIDLPDNETWRKVREKISPGELFPLDRRYGVAVFVGTAETRFCPVDRRGRIYRGIALPLRIEEIRRVDTRRVSGIVGESYSREIFIDFRPFRVMRFLPSDGSDS